MVLNPPIRKNVTILVPPVESISPKFETTLAPFIQTMKLDGKTFLILVRGRSAHIFNDESNAIEQKLYLTQYRPLGTWYGRTSDMVLDMY